MRALLGLAALAALTSAVAAQAQTFTTATFGASNASRWTTGTPQRDGRRGRMDVRVHRGTAAAYGYGGYDDYGDFDGNRGFDPDKWNDWWHDRPERAYPHWMSNNADCARRWYAGDVLTC